MRFGLAAGAALALLSACTMVQVPSPGWPAPGTTRGAAAGTRIPPGHLPPTGTCRVWLPDRLPGQQPPPGPCATLQFQVPPGAILVRE